jgi:hypothetical protein
MKKDPFLIDFRLNCSSLLIHHSLAYFDGRIEAPYVFEELLNLMWVKSLEFLSERVTANSLTFFAKILLYA